MSHQNTIILYGCPASLYTGKARSYLRKAGIPYVERLFSHPEFASKILPAMGRFVIPVVQTKSDEIIQDTTEIIDFFEGSIPNPFGAYPAGPKQKIIALILEMFGDEGLLRAAMHYRWNFPEQNQEFISMEFGRNANPAADNQTARDVAAPSMQLMSSYLPALGITDDAIPAIEESYKELLQVLDTHFLQHPYLLGGRPTAGDFGLYGPMYAHLARDPAPELLMKSTANRVWRWVERMTAPDQDMPEFAELDYTTAKDDRIPETLLPVLRLIAADYGTEIVALVAFINQYLEDNPAIEAATPVITDPKKRGLGRCELTLRSTPLTIGVRHYSMWMLQRVQDAYDMLTESEKLDVSSLLESTGLDIFILNRTSRRIERRNYTEVWGEQQS